MWASRPSSTDNRLEASHGRHTQFTRDRIYASAEWAGQRFNVVDTGGIEEDPRDTIASQTRRQAELAIEQADALIYVVDSRTGLTAEDDEVASLLRRSGKPVILAASKVDDPRHMDYELYGLGFDEVIPTSALHGSGIAELLDAVVKHLPQADPAESQKRTSYGWQWWPLNVKSSWSTGFSARTVP